MNEKMKQVMKRSLALMLATIMVIGAGVWMKDARLKADEEAPAAEVVVEEAAPAEAPAPAPVEEPVVVVEEVAIAEAPEKQEAEMQDSEPVADEEPVEQGTAAGRSEESVLDAPEQEAEAETNAETADVPEEAAEEEKEAPFDVKEAYEYYMSLATDEEKQAYLNSLSPADRKALEDYIAAKETEAANAAVMLAAAPAEGAEAEMQDAVPVAEEEPVAQETAAGRSEEDVLDVPEQEAEAEVEAEAEPEVKKSALLLAYEEYLNMTEEEQAAFLEGMTEKELARFEKLAELVEAEASFTVRFFDYEGNQIGEEQLVAAGASAVAPEVPFKEGEDFTGWNADYSCVLSDLDISPRTDDAEKNRQVIISYAGGRSRFSVGEQVTIVSELIGFEDAESIGYQWMYSLDGETWLEVPGAIDAEYSFTQTIETGTYYWKLMVNA